MAEEDEKGLRRKQSEHATRIKTERALMDTFGITRSQARAMNKGLTDFARRVAPAPEVLGPPMPPKLEVSETTSKAPSPNGLGRQGAQGTNAGGSRGGSTTIRAVVDSGGTLTGTTINVIVV